MKKQNKTDAKILKEDDKKFISIIGKRIRTIRNRQSKSAEIISEKINIGRSTLTKIETGDISVSAIMLWKIAAALHCKITDLFPEVPDSKSLSELDIENIKKDNEDAAHFVSKTFKIKSSNK